METVHRVENVQQYWKKWKRTKVKANDHMPMFENNQTKTLQENLDIIANQFVRLAEDKYSKINLKPNAPAPQTDEQELRSIIMNTSNEKSPGPDQMTNKLIKIIFKNDPEYLINLYNCMLRANELPERWKVGRMIYFTKPNRRLQKVTDLRPITLTNNFLKNGEALFARVIERALNEIKFFEENQFGFRAGKSTINAIEKVVKEIKAASRKEFAIMIALDFSGAFDSLSWKVVMRNVIRANLNNTFTRMVQSLLCDRRVILENRETISERGTPQGGRASPLLYRIGANSLLAGLNSLNGVRATAFADDTAIVATGDNERELRSNVKGAIRTITEWAKAAEIQLNSEKTETISIGRTKIERIEVGGSNILTRRTLRYLGVIIGENLKWNDQIDHLTNKTDQFLMRTVSMCWARGELKLSDRIQLYKKVFVPMMTYAFEVWYPDISEKVTYLERLNKLQRRVLRAVMGAYRNASTIKLMELAGIVPIETELKILNDTKMLRKEERRERRSELRESYLNDRESQYELSPNCMIGELRRREAVWCLTETGPFARFLVKIGKMDEDRCRLCELGPETAQHLLFECERVSSEMRLNDSYTAYEFERAAAKLIKFMSAIE